MRGNPSTFTMHFVVSSMKLSPKKWQSNSDPCEWMGTKFPRNLQKDFAPAAMTHKMNSSIQQCNHGHLECSNPPTQVNWKLDLPLLCCGRWRLTTHRFNSGFPAFSHQTWDRNIRCIVMLTNYAWVSSICFSVQDIQHMVSQYHQVIIILLFQAYWFTKPKCLAPCLNTCLLNSRGWGPLTWYDGVDPLVL